MNLKPNDILYNIINGKLMIIREVNIQNDSYSFTTREGNMEFLPIQYANFYKLIKINTS